MNQEGCRRDPPPNLKLKIMNKYDVKTVNGVDFVYIGNDVNGNCKYAVNYRYFLKEEEMGESFEVRRSIAAQRAKKAYFDREITSHIEPFLVIRNYGKFKTTCLWIEDAKES